MTASNDRVRVAVVGGGCASLTTAFELSRPEHQGRYEVTVYQMGWRLGGKGASGRGLEDRIEEHGLHLWMGFYENAFRLMRECYAERHKTHPEARFSDWRDAFKPAPDVGVTDLTEDGWEFWLAHFPPGQGEPGDSQTPTFSVVDYLRQSTTLVGELLRSAMTIESPGSGPGLNENADTGTSTIDGPEAIASAVDRLLRYGQLATTAAILEASQILTEMIARFFPAMFRDGAMIPLQLLDALTGVARKQLEALVSSDTELKRIWQVIDLILAVMRGSVRHGLALDPRGFDAINDYDWRDWLRMHGASERSLDSGFMRGIYDLAFAYEDGDVNRPRLAAGVALRGAMRMFFTYRGALFWRMSGGMGDVVFAPLYQVLKDRGVRFEFFHRLENVKLAKPRPGEAPYVQALEFNVQAEIEDGVEYQPLIDVHGVPSWPAQPLYRQLKNGAVLERDRPNFEAAWESRSATKKTLTVSRDFELVLLGVSIGALPHVAGELIDRAPGWRDMVNNVKTVPTQAFQLWLKKDVEELGWPCPAVNLSGYVEPFDTWADMSHLIAEENSEDQVRSIAYFCSVLPDGIPQHAEVTKGYHDAQRESVRKNATRYLNRDVGALWPNAMNKDHFRWELLSAPTDSGEAGDSAKGKRRFLTQFWTANVNPSDRYVLSVPGSTVYRISPLDMTFDNLTIAGDWTASGLDTGCIESAVISGLIAANAISSSPSLRDIVGYDHP